LSHRFTASVGLLRLHSNLPDRQKLMKEIGMELTRLAAGMAGERCRASL
jgi:hypothetical protein